MKHKTITLCGQEVGIGYCAATETGYETMSGQSISVFYPQGDEPPKATTEDYIRLAIAGIIAYYARWEGEAPIDLKNLIYDASPADITTMLTAIVELRNEWYQVPAVVSPEPVNPDEAEKEDSEKN